jgi:hypothetical protein
MGGIKLQVNGEDAEGCPQVSIARCEFQELDPAVCFRLAIVPMPFS